MMQDRLQKGRERLDAALEQVELLCEPVEPPKGELEYIRYFCGNVEVAAALEATAEARVSLYQGTAALLRAYANLADELEAAGYTAMEISRIKRQVEHYVVVRNTVRRASGESLDLKPYEADMRHLIDTYIQADEPKKISSLDDLPLLELIVQLGMDKAVEKMPKGIRDNPTAVAETVANNVRRKISKEHLNDPAFFEQMSALLKEVIEDLKAKRIEYAEYMARIAAIAKQVQAGTAESTPKPINTPGRRALYNNLGKNEALALQIDEAVLKARPDDWRGHPAREKQIKRALLPLVGNSVEEVERIFSILVLQKEY